MEDKCLRCGKCCHIIKEDNGKPFLSEETCPYLEKDGDKTKCLIYDIRLRTRIMDGFYCRLRCSDDYDYEGCPYNTDRPIVK